jgi:hypothetical protein
MWVLKEAGKAGGGGAIIPTSKNRCWKEQEWKGKTLTSTKQRKHVCMPVRTQ